MFSTQNNVTGQTFNHSDKSTAPTQNNKDEASGFLPRNSTYQNDLMTAPATQLNLCELCMNPEIPSLKLVNTMHGLRHEGTCENVKATGFDILFHQFIQEPASMELLGQSSSAEVQSNIGLEGMPSQQPENTNSNMSDRDTADQSHVIRELRSFGAQLESKAKLQLSQVKSDLSTMS